MICKQCNRSFESQRTTARYCSPQCRKLAFQNAEVSVPELSVPVSVPSEFKPLTFEQMDAIQKARVVYQMNYYKSTKEEAVALINENDKEDYESNHLA